MLSIDDLEEIYFGSFTKGEERWDFFQNYFQNKLVVFVTIK